MPDKNKKSKNKKDKSNKGHDEEHHRLESLLNAGIMTVL